MKTGGYRWVLGYTGNLYTGNEGYELRNTYMGTDGSTAPDVYYTSGKIYVIALRGRQLFVRAPWDLCNVVAFDEEDAPLAGANLSDGGGVVSLTVPANAYYVRVCVFNTHETQICIFGGRECRPVYGDSMALEYEKQTSAQYYKASLSDKLAFLRDEYDEIDGRDFDTEFFVSLFHRDGAAWRRLFDGSFHKTDCTFIVSDRRIEVTPEASDANTAVEDGMGNEYNLMALPIEKKSLRIFKRPILQIYTFGADGITNFTGGTYWEGGVTDSGKSRSELNDMSFVTGLYVVDCHATARGGADAKFAGSYAYSRQENSPSRMPNTKIGGDDDTVGCIFYSSYDGISGNTTWVAQMMERVDGSWQIAYTGAVETDSDTEEATFTCSPMSGRTGSFLVRVRRREMLGRMVLDIAEAEGANIQPIGSDDLVADNRNYHYRRPYPFVKSVIHLSTEVSREPTEWGISADNAYYFKKPYSSYGMHYMPYNQEDWDYFSIWVSLPVDDHILSKNMSRPYTLKDTYTLASCISALLSQFAPHITHRATEKYSAFLYGADNPISPGAKFELLCTQMTNVTRGAYTVPAQKAVCTLEDILGFLQKCFNCYWFVDSENRLRIEHVQYFRNGGSYGGEPNVSVDYTKLINVRNGKPWDFAAGEVTFNKSQMAQRYEYGWPNDCTEAFDGMPMEMLGSFVEKGKKEEVNVATFLTDIDYVLLEGTNLNEDGLIMFAAVKGDDGLLELPIVERSVGGFTNYLQNGYLAFCDLQPRYLTYDVPTRRIKVNGEEAVAKSVSRQKQQTVTAPMPIDIDPRGEVKTSVGTGEVKKIELNLQSKASKTVILYDTQQ